VPWLGAGASLLRNPTAFFQTARARHGDSFVVDAFGFRLFCVFSPEGVRALYALPENQASFGLATFNLVFKHKAPRALLAGRRHRPHDLFGSQEVEGYLGELERAVALQLDELGNAGRFESFAFARRLGHRLGLGCWAGEEAASAPYLDRLIPLLDHLDTAESFVNPALLFVARATGKRREKAALAGLDALLGEVIRARDVVLIHLGAQSNLYAALAWTLVNLLLHPDVPARELVSSFGHGRHACPAQRFSITAIRVSLRRPLERFEVTPQFAVALPRARQLGAVARAAGPCVVAYRAR